MNRLFLSEKIGAALAAVSYMFLSRIRELKRKALTIFMYLAREAIKEDKENFKATFDDIERYLNPSLD